MVISQKKIIIIMNSVVMLCGLCCSQLDETKLITYPAPESEPASTDFAMTANGKNVFIYQARVSAWPINQVWPGYQRPKDQTEIASFAYFDFKGQVTLEIESKRPIDTVMIRPESYAIKPEIVDNKIRFALNRPRKIVVEINGYHHALHIFANDIEKHKPNMNDPQVHYFGPGVHKVGIIQMKSDETIYVAGGAIVYGVIEALDVSNISILGRGILDASKIGRFDAKHMIAIRGCRNVKVDGIICRDPHKWTVVPVDCRDIQISDIKLIGLWRYNADGIDVVNSQNVFIDNCFVRAFDDNIVLKGLHPKNFKVENRKLKNIHVKNCVLWNDWGRAIEIGAETVADSITDVTFENCDIIHFVHIALDIQNGDRAVVKNIFYDNIRIEDPIVENARIADHHYAPEQLGRLIDLNIRKNNYSKDTIRGHIEDIFFNNITYTGSHLAKSRMFGFDKDHLIRNVLLKNIMIQGKQVLSFDDASIEINKYVKDVRFCSPWESIPGR